MYGCVSLLHSFNICKSILTNILLFISGNVRVAKLAFFLLHLYAIRPYLDKKTILMKFQKESLTTT